MLKRVLIGLLIISVVAIWATVTEAGWVCLCNGGKSCCTYRSGSVIATQTACGVHPDDLLGLTVTPPPGTNDINFIVFCRNKGQNAAPGVQAVANATAENFTALGEGDIDRNGCARNIKTTVQFTQFFDTLDEVCNTELNFNWDVAALVACEATFTATVLDETSQEVSTNTFHCRLPVTQCDPNATITLGWDKKAGTPQQVEYINAETGQKCGQD